MKLIISFSNIQSKEALAIICDKSIFNAINSYSIENYSEDHSESYNFEIPDDMSEMVSIFFADENQLQEIEIKYSKHTIGKYYFEFDVNYHNTVDTSSDNFKLLISDWIEYLKTFTHDIQTISLDYDNIEASIKKHL